MNALTKETRAEKRSRLNREQAEREQKELEKFRAEYPKRFNEFRALLDSMKVDYKLNVDENLTPSLHVGDLELSVDEQVFRFYGLELTKDTALWELESNVERLKEYESAKESHADFLNRTREFKKSLTEEQKKMVRYFNWV